MVAKDLLNQAAKKCPESKLFMSGYSEGGMVSHNGVAYAEEETKKHVAVSTSSLALPVPCDPFMPSRAIRMSMIDPLTISFAGCHHFRRSVPRGKDKGV
jgi:hypothetical protein